MHKKAYDDAIDDFQKVAKYDNDMKWESNRLIKECKELKKELRKKDKKIAQNLISGYSEDKPEPEPEPINLQTPDMPPPSEIR